MSFADELRKKDINNRNWDESYEKIIVEKMIKALKGECERFASNRRIEGVFCSNGTEVVFYQCYGNDAIREAELDKCPYNWEGIIKDGADIDLIYELLSKEITKLEFRDWTFRAIQINNTICTGKGFLGGYKHKSTGRKSTNILVSVKW